MENYGTYLTCNQKWKGDVTNKKQCATILAIVGDFCLETVFMRKVSLTDCTFIFKVKYINLFTFPNLCLFYCASITYATSASMSIIITCGWVLHFDCQQRRGGWAQSIWYGHFRTLRKRKILTVITDSVVLLSSDFALLRGGRVEAKSKSSPASRLCP